MREVLSQENVDLAIEILLDTYPDASVELDHENNFELLIATILSAQCTDVRVNKITKVLFDRVKTPEEYLDLGQEELEDIIRSCGLYRNKAKNILGTCKMLIEEYNGEVPGTLKELTKLPGVGRKTANVVLSNGFGIPAIAVDTHVFRVANRIGITDAKNVNQSEKQLMERIDRDMWSKAHHLIIFHGRRICKARNPLCEECPLREICEHINN